MSEIYKFKCGHYRHFDGQYNDYYNKCKNIYFAVHERGDFEPNDKPHEKAYKDPDSFHGCMNCNSERSLALKHNEFSDTEKDILLYVSRNRYYISCLREENEELKNSVRNLESELSDLKDEKEQMKEEIEQSNNNYLELQRQIEGLQVAHEALLDTFRGYNK